VQLRLDVVHGLEAHDFTDLWREKHGAHLPGTREWAFKEVFAWLDAAPTDAAQLFWLMGGGGVGKSVLTAELLRRAYGSNRVVAWHFCRHDNPQQSSPDALLRSLAAMLCARLPGYKEALGEVASELRKSTDPKELFAALFAAPLQKVKSPAKPSLIILDALDELPKQGQKPLLSVIAAQLSTLPPWLRLFVTSREEPQIKAALAKFEPKELRADEEKNRADVAVRLGRGATP
jgi:ATP/maltotriose-dependent transcriptional regulator MalT